jgi:exonuclease III
MNGKDRIITDKLKLWYKVYFNSSKNSRGVAVLIGNQVEHELLEAAVDPQENVLLLRIVLGRVEAVIGAVYGPNDNNCAPFFDFIGATLNRWNNLPCILGGDWNTTPSSLPAAENPDIFSMANIPSKGRSEGVEALCNNFDLSDPYRVLDPETRDYTYVPSGVVRRNRSHIDFFLASSDLYDGINACSIAQGFSRKSFDHKPIFLNFQKKKGRGRACVFNSTINHKLAEDIVRLAVHNNAIRSALAVAGPAASALLNNEMERMSVIVNLINRHVDLQGTTETRDQTEAELEELLALEADLATEWAAAGSIEYLQNFERQVTPDVFFENLVEDCKISLITLQNRIKSAANRYRKEWTTELAALKKAGTYGDNVERINHLESKLNEASERYVSERLGNYVKTELLNSEKMTPKFLKIAESSQKSDLSVIKKPDGALFTRDGDRDRYIVEFYEELYKKPAAAPIDFSNCVRNFLGNLCDHLAIKSCCISEEEKEDLELDITIEELDEAVKSCNLKSAPGIDGFNNRFILKFWRHFRKPLHDYFTYCSRTGSLTPTFRTALIKLIPKKGDQGQLKNWRPISLLSYFYKIISKAVNARLDRIIDKVTSLDQKAYNKNRYIQEALINTIDAIRHCEKNKISGVVLSIDQKKAFDSVYHGYMREVYKFFGFGEKFIFLLELIGTNRTARIILDGSISREFDLERGFAQGNGPSPKKYNIGEQILLFRLEYDPNLAGVYNMFIIPRNIVNGVEYLPAADQAREKGLQVDSELCQNKRRASAFADDTSE